MTNSTSYRTSVTGAAVIGIGSLLCALLSAVNGKVDLMLWQFLAALGFALALVHMRRPNN